MIRPILLLFPACIFGQSLYVSPGFQSKANIDFRTHTQFNQDFTFSTQHITSSTPIPVSIGLVLGINFPKSRKIEAGYFREDICIRNTVSFFSYSKQFNSYTSQHLVSNNAVVGSKILFLYSTSEKKINNLHISFSFGLSYFFQKQQWQDTWQQPPLLLDTSRVILHSHTGYSFSTRALWPRLSSNAEYRNNNRSYYTLKLFFEIGNRALLNQFTNIQVIDNNGYIKNYNITTSSNGTGLGLQLTKSFYWHTNPINQLLKNDR